MIALLLYRLRPILFILMLSVASPIGFDAQSIQLTEGEKTEEAIGEIRGITAQSIRQVFPKTHTRTSFNVYHTPSRAIVVTEPLVSGVALFIKKRSLLI
jgi:hypothetical protein